MRVTDPAADAILKVMQKKNLDPSKYFLEVGVFEGNLGLAFTKNRHGRALRFGALTVVVASNVDTTGVVVDFREIDGRKGLLFTGEDDGNTNHVHGASDPGSQDGHGGSGV